MTGHNSDSKIHRRCCEEELANIRALQSPSGNDVDISSFSDIKLESRNADHLHHIGRSHHEDSTNASEWQFIPHLFLRWTRFPKSTSRTSHAKEYHDVTYVIDVKARPESLSFYQTANGCVLSSGAFPAKFPKMIVNLKDGSLRFVNDDTN